MFTKFQPKFANIRKFSNRNFPEGNAKSASLVELEKILQDERAKLASILAENKRR